MTKRRALSVAVLTAWGASATVLATACAGGALDDGPQGTGGVPSVFAGGSGPQGSGGSSASGASATMGGSVGNGGSNTSNGGSVSSAGGSESANGGSSSTSGGAGGSVGSSGAAGATGSGGGSSNCADTPPPNGDTCAHAVEYGWCTQSWLNGACARSCGKCSSGASGGANGSGGSANGSGGANSGGTGKGGTTGSGGTTTGGPYGGGGGQPPRLDSGTNGWASRFWDCCKPACGWKANVGGRTPVTACSAQNQSLGSNYDAKNACESGGSAHVCWSFAPWAVSETLAYGYAAVNQGSDYCGKCYQLQFTGGSNNGTVDKGSQALANKTMVVQAINNGGVGSNQFDLLIPGGGVGDFDACSAQWGTTNLGERYGGFFLACQKENAFDYDKSKACAAQRCQTVFSGKPDLLAGCNWFVDWFGAPDNPSLIFKEITCPEALTTRSGLRR